MDAYTWAKGWMPVFNYCDVCGRQLSDEVTTVQIQSGQIVRLTSGSFRINAPAPQYHVLCTPCGQYVTAAMQHLYSTIRRDRVAG